MDELVEEQVLLDAAIQGDSLACERLLLKSYSALERHIRPKIPPEVRRHCSVEDILQLVFSQVFRDIAQYQVRANSSFFAWLKTITDHRLEDERKKHQRQKRGGNRHQLSIAHLSQNNSLAGLIDVICLDTRVPDRSVARHEAEKAIQVAVAMLDAKRRNVIRARYFEGKSIEEVARDGRLTRDAVRGLLYRAKKNLRAALGRSSQWLTRR